MSTSDQDILIKVLTAFESGGIDAAKKAAQELKTTVDANSDSGKVLSGIMDMLNNKSGDAATVFKGLSGIMRGGTGVANGLATAVKGLGGALGMAAGPLAILTTAVMAGVTAWQSYKQKQEEAAEAARKAAEEEKQAAEELAKSLDEAAKNAAAGARAEVKGIVDDLTAAAKRAKELDDALSAIDDAQLGLELAELDAKLVGEQDEGKRAEIEQQKKRLKAGRERQKLEASLVDMNGEMSLMSDQEAAAQKKAEQKAAALEEAETQWKNDAEWAYGGAIKELRQTERNRDMAKGMFGFAGDYEKQVEDARKKADEAEANLKNYKEQHEAERTAMKAEIEAARKAAEDLKAANDQRRKVLQANIDATQIKLQTADIVSQSSESKYILDRNEAIDKDTAKAAEWYRKGQEDVKKEAEARDKAMSYEDRVLLAQGFVAPMQRVGGQYYDGDAAGNVPQMAKDAIADAAEKIKEGKEDREVFQQLIVTLQNLGAVIPNLSGLASCLDKIDGQIDGLKREAADLQLQIEKLR